jgi:type II secretory pathway pseudopilin PulG
MKKTLQQRRRTEDAAGQQRGFSVIEILVAVALLMAVLGVVVKGMSDVQQRNYAETSNVDAVQDARDFIDQMVRDIHGVGFPPPRAICVGSAACPAALQNVQPYCTDPKFDGQPNAPVRMNPNISCGITSFSTTNITYEADLDGTGIVSVVFLNLVPGTNTNTCPCILQRGVVRKIDWVNTNGALAPLYFTTVNGVLNSGNGAGGAIIPAVLTGPGNYQAYTTADVFDAYDANANLITAACTMGIPGNPGTAPDCSQIRSLQITVNVVPNFADPTTRQFRVFSITSKARINF